MNTKTWKTLEGAESAARSEFDRDGTPHDVYAGSKRGGRGTVYTILPAGYRNRDRQGHTLLYSQRLVARMDTGGHLTRV